MLHGWQQTALANMQSPLVFSARRLFAISWEKYERKIEPAPDVKVSRQQNPMHGVFAHDVVSLGLSGCHHKDSIVLPHSTHEQNVAQQQTS